MNCRDIEAFILTEPDGVLTYDQHAALEGHVAACASCRQFRARLSEAMTAFRADAATVAVPDIEAEWRQLRGQLHRQSAKSARKRPLAPVIWFGSSLAAAAALALAYVGLQPQPAPRPATAPLETARAEYVEAGDANAATMVYVDKDSGWLVVWAVDSTAKNNG